MRAYNNLPQPNPYILVFGGCGRLLHALTPPRSASCIYSFWHGVIPTSYLIFILVEDCTVVGGLCCTVVGGLRLDKLSCVEWFETLCSAE